MCITYIIYTVLLHAFRNLTQERFANNSEIQLQLCVIKSTLLKPVQVQTGADFSSDLGCLFSLGSWHIEINETESSTDLSLLKWDTCRWSELVSWRLIQSSVYNSHSCSTHR